MNTNPKAIRILCYGDSNTHGTTPTDSRFPINLRWTGLLQIKLGDGYEVIEEGLNGRTINLDDPQKDGRNGKAYLYPCFKSHSPLDIVILMLGINDLKERFNKSPEEVAEGTKELIRMVKEVGVEENGNSPKIILISPALVNEHVDNPTEGFKGAEAKSKLLAKFYQEVAIEEECEFIDISQHIEPSDTDGLHFEKDAHAKIAEILFDKVQSICGKSML